VADWRRTTLADLLMRRKGDEATPEADTIERPEDTLSDHKTPFWKRKVRFERSANEVENDLADEAAATESKRWFSWRRHEPDADAGPRDVAEEPTVDHRAPFWRRKGDFGRSEHEVEEDVGSDAPAAERKPWFSFRRRDDVVDADLGVGEPSAEPSREVTPFPSPDAGFAPAADEVEVEPGVEAPETERAARFSWRRRRGDSVEGDFETADVPQELALEEERIPFWKRNMSFRRRADAAADDAGVDEPPVESKPWLSFGRRDEDAGPSVDVAQPHDDTVPFWKRNLSFGRRVDAVGEERGVEADGEKKSRFSFGRREDSFDGDLDAGLRADEKTPFRKRRPSFGRSAPDVDEGATSERPAGERKARFAFRQRDESVAGDPDAADSQRKPFYKRELGLPFAGRGGDGAPGARGRKKQPLVGLKVGASQIAAAHIANNGSPELLQVARQPIETGIVVGGELRDPEALAEALRDFFAENNLPSRGVRLGIGNNRIGVRSFEITGVHDPSQLENAIRFRAQEALPIPLDEAVLDYQVIDETVSPTGMRTYRVLLVVAYRELIDRYIAACRGAGLRLAGIDLEAFALLRALLPPSSESLPEDTALVAVSIGHDRSTFAVSNGIVCEFTRVLDWGGAALNSAIARALDITPSQAEPVKRALALPGADDARETPPDDYSARAAEAVRLELQSFARELVSSLHFYQNQPGSLAIGSIVLTGGTAHMPGLAGELQRLTGVKVRVGDPLRRVRGAKRIEAPEQLGSFAVAIGLGIDD
jgi:type IV pilus assembly protein PilM